MTRPLDEFPKKPKQQIKGPIKTFEQLDDYLKSQGYYVKRKGPGKNYREVFGQGIIGGYYANPTNEHHQHFNKYTENRFTFDNVKCFYKWSYCPLSITLPVDQHELLKMLRFLGSKEGEYLSNNFMSTSQFIYHTFND